jgi:hypothetical protein
VGEVGDKIGEASGVGIPAKAGMQGLKRVLDFRLRVNDSEQT